MWLWQLMMCFSSFPNSILFISLELISYENNRKQRKLSFCCWIMEWSADDEQYENVLLKVSTSYYQQEASELAIAVARRWISVI